MKKTKIIKLKPRLDLEGLKPKDLKKTKSKAVDIQQTTSVITLPTLSTTELVFQDGDEEDQEWL